LPVWLLLREGAGWLQVEIPEIPPAFGLVAVLVLVLLNGFFVATEFALVAVRRTRIEQLVAEGNRAAGTVQRAVDHLNNYIAGTQFGITLASLALGWVGEPALAHLLDPLLSTFLPPEGAFITAHGISILIAFSLITCLHMVLGEFAPKGLALQRAEGTALFVAGAGCGGG
jgi:putative hemolysin